MRIGLDNVLWRTRGRGWDYTFVLRPADPPVMAWYDFHADVFSEVAPGKDPVSTGGYLHLESSKKIPFIATTFQDPTLRDAAQRPIAHYIIWFPKTAAKPTEFVIPVDWGVQVVDAFGEGWHSAFESDGKSDDDLLEPARAILKEVVLLDQRAALVTLSRQIIEKKKALNRAPLRKRSFPRLLAATTAVLLALLVYWLTRR